MGLVLLLLLGLAALTLPRPDAPDLQLHAGVTEAVRHDGGYYAVAADVLRSGGYPITAFTLPLPTLAVVHAWLPSPVVLALLYLLAAGMTLAWFERFRVAFRQPAAVWAAMTALTAGAIVGWQAQLVAVPEVWAGLLIALSLARRDADRWTEAVGWGLAAALIGDAAVAYLIVMAAVAWRDGVRREAIGWGLALGVFTIVFALHAHAVAQVVRPSDAGIGLWPAFAPGLPIRTWSGVTLLDLLPLSLAALLVLLAIAGWSAWPDPVALRTGATLVAYALLMCLAGPFATAALLTAPVLLIGLMFVPDVLRDLGAAALDRRRIVVRRVSP